MSEESENRDQEGDVEAATDEGSEAPSRGNGGVDDAAAETSTGAEAERTDAPAGDDAGGSQETPERPPAEPPAAPTVEDLLTERDRLRDRLLRTAADLDNFRKRTRREVEDAERRAQEQIILELLPLVDNLERAERAAKEATDVAGVAEGVRMVIGQFQEFSARLGIERIQSVGEKFDPNLHDALQQVSTNDHPVGTIVAEVAPGYTRAGRLLRAAAVVVARPAAEEEPS